MAEKISRKYICFDCIGIVYSFIGHPSEFLKIRILSKTMKEYLDHNHHVCGFQVSYQIKNPKLVASPLLFVRKLSVGRIWRWQKSEYLEPVTQHFLNKNFPNLDSLELRNFIHPLTKLNMSSLKALKLCSCKKVESSAFETLKNLKKLEISMSSYCLRYKLDFDLSVLTIFEDTLEKLTLDTLKWKTVKPLCVTSQEQNIKLKKLRKLVMKDVRMGIYSNILLTKVPNLEELKLHRVDGFKFDESEKFMGLGILPKLKYLSCRDCLGIEEGMKKNFKRLEECTITNYKGSTSCGSCESEEYELLHDRAARFENSKNRSIEDEVEEDVVSDSSDTESD